MINTEYRYISTTLPYLNSEPHMGHCFEFVLADVLAEYHRMMGRQVILNVGVDEHGQKVAQKAVAEGYADTQEYCDVMATKWKHFCQLLNINHDSFYRTTAADHKQNVLRFYNEIKQYVFEKEYKGKYCEGCEAFVTDKQWPAWDLNKCQIHNNTDLKWLEETNKFFDLSVFRDKIEDVLVDKNKSLELANIINNDFDLSITRQFVSWGVPNGDGQVFYVWFEALLNYIFAIDYYADRAKFFRYWENSLIICGKDNLKFQAYILQALLLANNIPQTNEVLVHGNILDALGAKMSKSIGNVIDPVQQVEKYGLDPLRYYLVFGLNTFDDSKYSESELAQKWNCEIVNGLGNLISRLLHLIELRNVILDERHGNMDDTHMFDKAFEKYDFKLVGNILNENISYLNSRITNEKPYAKDCENYEQVLNEIYFQLKAIIPYYKLVLKGHAEALDRAFEVNKKVILFERIG